jgi:hypothetical protein
MKLAAMQALHQRHWPQRFAAANAVDRQDLMPNGWYHQVYSAPKNPPS